MKQDGTQIARRNQDRASATVCEHPVRHHDEECRHFVLLITALGMNKDLNHQQNYCINCTNTSGHPPRRRSPGSPRRSSLHRLLEDPATKTQMKGKRESSGKNKEIRRGTKSETKPGSGCLLTRSQYFRSTAETRVIIFCLPDSFNAK